MPDIIKYIAAVAVAIAGVAGFYYLPELVSAEVPSFARGGLVILAMVLALVVFATTEPGGRILEFARGSRTEVRKMVWPTRKETIQGTVMVIVMVIFIGLLLWGFDWVIFTVIYDWVLRTS